MKSKFDRTVFCTKIGRRIKPYDCSICNFKVYSTITKVSIKGKKHKSTKATEIPKKVKLLVWERDNHCCIFCGMPVPWNMANSHFIKRSHLGLGIEQNIMTNCPTCHREFEKEPKNGSKHEKARRHFRKCYYNWDEKKIIYHK